MKKIEFYPDFRDNLRNNQNIVLFRTEGEQMLSNEWTITIKFPKFYFGCAHDGFGEKSYEYSVDFASKIRYTWDSTYWNFIFVFLGFGFTIGHQTGY